jgi:hypothetical protein
MQGHHFVATQLLHAVCGHYILLHMLGWQSMVIAQRLAGADQLGVVLQAGQLLAGLQQAAAQVALARTPVQPVLWAG